MSKFSYKCYSLLIKDMAEYLNAFLYMPGIENMLANTSTRFRQFRNLHGTKDSSQIFTKTRKDAQNTNITILPNFKSTFQTLSLFISRVYTGNIRDKKLKLVGGSSDHILRFFKIQADKDFNFLDMRPERNVYFEVLPGKTRKIQIKAAELCKTKAMVKLPCILILIACILIEQVIQRLKTFVYQYLFQIKLMAC